MARHKLKILAAGVCLALCTSSYAVTIKFAPKDKLEKVEIALDELSPAASGVDIDKAKGDWFLDDRYTLRENIDMWAEIAQIQTGNQVRVIWEAEGPGLFQLPFYFTGTWDEAFLKLGEAAQTSNWPLKIEINTTMNSVVVKQLVR